MCRTQRSQSVVDRISVQWITCLLLVGREQPVVDIRFAAARRQAQRVCVDQRGERVRNALPNIAKQKGEGTRTRFARRTDKSVKGLTGQSEDAQLVLPLDSVPGERVLDVGRERGWYVPLVVALRYGRNGPGEAFRRDLVLLRAQPVPLVLRCGLGGEGGKVRWKEAG